MRKKKSIRKFHRKSRNGCINCRFRRVKCDETKPDCKKCHDYMVPCQYSAIVNDFPNTREAVYPTDIQRVIASSPPYSKIVQFTQEPSIDQNHEYIVRFKQRTAFTFGTATTVQLYAETVPRLALQHEFLLHAIIATTMFHEQALIGLDRRTSATAYHLTQSAALFNQKLSQHQREVEGDALWATAVYLCAISVFDISSSNPEQNWPIRAAHPTDLEWLNMQAGLKVIWNMANMDRSCVFGQAETQGSTNCVNPGKSEPGIDGIPDLLVRMCQLHPHSTAENNPYHTAVRRLTTLLSIDGTSDNVLMFMVFAGGMEKAFQKLLFNKDPVALILLAVWYSKLFHTVWWMAPRARVECRSICCYLLGLKPINRSFSRTLETVHRAVERRDSSLPAAFLLKAQHLRCQPARNRPNSIKVDMF